MSGMNGEASGCWVAGKPASLDDAVSTAARLLNESRAPLVAGLAADLAGVEEAVALARTLRATMDHAHADAALRDLDASRALGLIATTPLQARALADAVVLVGPGISEAWPDYAACLALDSAPTVATQRTRRVVRICPGREGARNADVAGGAAELPVTLGALRAIVGGRPTMLAPARVRSLAACAEVLKGAQYGVIMWSAAHIDALSVEMLAGLIDDLNGNTRCAALPIPPAGNALGAMQTTAALTGFPLRVSFGREKAEHDPWRFDTARMLEDGEADCVLWVGAMTDAVPPESDAGLIALLPEDAARPRGAAVTITVGRPGVDHDAIVFDGRLGGMVAQEASDAGDAPPVAEILRRLRAACKRS